MIPKIHADDPGTHRCFCVLVRQGGVVDECRGYVASRDEPFCGDCTDRHPDAFLMGVHVRTRALAGGMCIPEQRRRRAQ